LEGARDGEDCAGWWLGVCGCCMGVWARNCGRITGICVGSMVDGRTDCSGIDRGVDTIVGGGSDDCCGSIDGLAAVGGQTGCAECV